MHMDIHTKETSSQRKSKQLFLGNGGSEMFYVLIWKSLQFISQEQAHYKESA